VNNRDFGSFLSAYEHNLHSVRYKNPGDADENSWNDTFARVARAVSKGNKDLESRFLDMMSSGLVIPSSPQLWNYGAQRRYPRNGSSCFTLRMGDTLDGFREADGSAESVYVASGGAGVLLDEVRPRGTHIRHCYEGAMGSMCSGGPALRLEGTTGYITGSGRARGALMLQLSVRHPDAIEFILAKLPKSLGFLDDWRANAVAVIGQSQMTKDLTIAIERFCSHWCMIKNWPDIDDVLSDLANHGVGADVLREMIDAGVVKVVNRLVIPMVCDWSTMEHREANRDWDLPLQNCNMSVRVPDEFMKAVENDDDWVFHWFDSDPPKNDENGWTKTDAITGGELKQYTDGKYFSVVYGMTKVTWSHGDPPDGSPQYRYGVVITTWEGLMNNMAPNQNMWRDTEYARFVRTKLIPTIGHMSGKIKARQIWDIICKMAHSHADPGVVFESTYERFQPVCSETYGPRLSNPCSEYVNSAGGSCNLCSVNLRKCADLATRVISNVHRRSAEDFKELIELDEFNSFIHEVQEAARTALVYIAHALEYNVAPVDYIHDLTMNHFRTVGVGIMGLAEAMMIFGIEYGSQASESFSAYVMSIVNLTAWEESFSLASKGWKKPEGWNSRKMTSIFGYRQRLASRYNLPSEITNRYRNLQRRAAKGDYATHTCVTSVAPTGTISMIATWVLSNLYGQDVSVTSGCEPPFAWSTFRQDNSGSCIVNHDLKNDELNQPWMKTSSDVMPEEHIKIQAAVAAFTCMSVSKTVNMPNTASVEDISNAYTLAWKMGVPGTAVYRDRSKPMQVLSALDCPSGECAVSVKDS